LLLLETLRPPLKPHTLSYTTLFRSESDETLPEFANQRVRCAIAFLETIEREPDNVRNLDFLLLEFDKHGRLDRKVQEQKLHDSSDRKITRLNSSHEWISYAVFCLKK